MELVKSLWQQLQESDGTYSLLSVKELKDALNTMFVDRKTPSNFIPAHLVLNMDNEEFKSFMKSKNDWRITCNLEQHKLIEKRINEINN